MGDEGLGKGNDRQAMTAALVGFRHELFGCLDGWGDAMFELCDALLCAPGPLRSVPSLSPEPAFRRSHGSLYKSLAHGSLDTGALRRAVVARRPADWPAVFAVDASTWDRCDADCSPERGYYYSASKHFAGQPIVAGWCYQVDRPVVVGQRQLDRSCRCRPHRPQRERHHGDGVAGETPRRLLGQDDAIPMFVFDAGYDPAAGTVASPRPWITVTPWVGQLTLGPSASSHTCTVPRSRARQRRRAVSPVIPRCPSAAPPAPASSTFAGAHRHDDRVSFLVKDHALDDRAHQPEHPLPYARVLHPVCPPVLEFLKTLENLGSRRGAAADGLLRHPRIGQESQFCRWLRSPPEAAAPDGGREKRRRAIRLGRSPGAP